MRVGSLVRHHSTTGNNVCGIGVILEIKDKLDWNGNTHVVVHWTHLGTRTENSIILREIICK